MPDPVDDGGVKKPECGAIKSLFHMCSKGDSAKPEPGIAPMITTNVAPMDAAGQKIVAEKAQNGDYGQGIQSTANAIKRRMDTLNSI